jgi:hypothetical protein
MKKLLITGVTVFGSSVLREPEKKLDFLFMLGFG